MNIGDLSGGLGSQLGNAKKLFDQLTPIFKLVGIDPAKQVNNFGRGKIQAALDKAKPKVVAYYEKNGFTPAKKDSDDPKVEKAFVKEYLFQIAKHTLIELLPSLPGPAHILYGIGADAIRDPHVEKTYQAVKAELDPTDSVAVAVDLISHELFEEVL